MPTKKSSKQKAPDIYEKLKEDHRLVEDLFEKILKTKNKDTEKREKLFRELDMHLTAHAEAEEALFYPRTEGEKPTHDLTLESYEEHRIAKVLLNELSSMDMSTDIWRAKVKVLSELIKHHVKEEEKELFPKSKKIIEREEAKELAEDVTEFEENEFQQAQIA